LIIIWHIIICDLLEPIDDDIYFRKSIRHEDEFLLRHGTP